MRDRIISNVLIKMGNRIKKKELDYLENVLVEEFRDVQIKKESTELTEYNDSLRKLKDTFLATLIVENKSNRTIEQYNLHLTQFVDYFTAKEAKDIDATDIRGFLYAYKQSRGISNLSLNNKRSAISSFFSWLADEEYIDKDPTRKIKKIKVTKKKKKAFTADEMERMRIACTDIRDRALIEMLASTGCRVSELSSIKLNDIDFIRKKVRIIGKGDKERTVFISDQAMIYLNRYLETRKDNNISLFVSKRYPYGQLRKDGIDPEPAFRRAIRRCGNFHGKGFKEACGGSNDGKKFAGVFLGELGQKTFEMDVHEVTDSEVPVDFHYCALLNAWKKQGFDDETCALLCDIAMDGDRGIAEEMGLTLDLTDTIAKGCATCKLCFHK